jgi:hypothetical protein
MFFAIKINKRSDFVLLENEANEQNGTSTLR